MSFLQGKRNYQPSTDKTSLKMFIAGRFTPNNSQDSSMSNKVSRNFQLDLFRVFSAGKMHVQETSELIYSKINSSVKRMSLFPPKGSMTLEAAIVLPLFLFFFINLLSILEMMRLHSNLSMALRETGNDLAIYGYAYRKLDDSNNSVLGETIMSVSFSYIYVKNKIIAYAGKEYLQSSPLKDVNRLLFWETHIMEEEDTIELLLTYKVSPVFSLAGFREARMYNCYYIRAWTGFDVADEEGEVKEYVYVTETGEVYHVDLNCTHLKMSINEVYLFQIHQLRNIYGEKYDLCSLCDRAGGFRVFITETGNKYHQDLQCSALKRTVTKVLKSEVGAYRPCKRCGEKSS